MPLPSQPPTVYLSTDNPADNDGLLAGMSTLGLAMGVLVLLLAVALFVWQSWRDRRDQREHPSAERDTPRPRGQGTSP